MQPAVEDSPATTQLELDPSLTAFEQLASLTDDPESSIDDVTLALAEFTAHFGPLGEFTGVAPDESIHKSATGAVLAVQDLWDELSADQQQAIDDALEPITSPSNWVDSFTLDDLDLSGSGPQGFAGLHPIPDPDDLTAAGQTLRDVMTRSLGRLRAQLPVEITSLTVAVAPASAFRGTVEALNVALEPASDRRADYADEGFDNNCVLIFKEDVLETSSPTNLSGMVTHELFHCWHFHRADLSTAKMRRPGNWVVEGLASYVGEAVGGTFDESETWWPWYIEPRGYKRSFDMFTRTFDTIGFWSRIAEYADIWAVIPAVVDEARVGSNLSTMQVAIDAVGSNSAWIAAGPLQRPEFGPDWTATGPGMPTTQRTTTFFPATSARAEVLGAGTGVQRAFEVDVSPVPSADGSVVKLSGTGLGVARFEESENEADFVMTGADARADVCIGECLCPDGSHAFADRSLPAGNNTLWAAVLGNAPDSRIDMSVIEFVETDWCAEDSDSDSGDDDRGSDVGDDERGSVVGTWRATGDAIAAMYEQASAYDDGTRGPVVGLEVVATSGDLVMDLRADGTGTLQYSDVNVSFDAAPNIVVNGGGTFSYGISGTELRITGTEVSINVTSEALYGLEIPPLTLTSADLPGGGMTTLELRADDSTLTFLSADGTRGGVFFPFHWIRQ